MARVLNVRIPTWSTREIEGVLLIQFIAGPSAIGDASQPNKSNRRTMCVTKWVDYSNKYGFGFQLSNNSVGILFNDNTRMMLAEDSTYVTHFLLLPYFGMAFYRISLYVDPTMFWIEFLLSGKFRKVWSIEHLKMVLFLSRKGISRKTTWGTFLGPAMKTNMMNI